VSILIRNGTIVTMNDAADVLHGDVTIAGGVITSAGGAGTEATFDTVIDATGCLVVPGFVQTHIHLCQTLFRGAADDRPLLAWLRDRIWPLEAAHDRRSLAASARLAAAELLAGGTTCALTMETVHETDAVFEALEPTGLRAVVGKCLMDERDGVPARLYQPAREALDESLALHRRWNGSGPAGGRLRAALAPRFALSCTRDLLERTAEASATHDLLVHTHAAEQRDEVELVRRWTGQPNVAYLGSVGLATSRLCAAHCVWTTEDERRFMAERDIKVLHCPGSNLKLGSGIAPIADYLARGITVSLGADGAACNNALDMFQEMRLASTLQSMVSEPGAVAARDALWMATRAGARTLGLEREIGSIEPGKQADVIVVGAEGPHQRPAHDPYSVLVFSSRAADVRVAIVGGDVVYRDGQLSWGDAGSIAVEADECRRAVARRAGIA
jgi:5-methylthioadenosine/S-adenosylhomocysteine deaminase